MTKEEFQKLQEEELKDIPEAFHGFVRMQAWDIGHAYGYSEVLIHVRNLISNIKSSIKKYHDQILKDGEFIGKHGKGAQ